MIHTIIVLCVCSTVSSEVDHSIITFVSFNDNYERRNEAEFTAE